MILHPTALPDCYIIEPKVFKDSRGLFFESYNKADLENALKRPVNFVQDNHSVSRKGVLRGLHFQKGEFAQAKLVRVVTGEAQDVVVDLREDSPTFGHHISMRLSAKNRLMIFIPRGMAHGFVALEDNTCFLYKCDNYYNMEAEGGIKFNDPDLAINWELPQQELILSEKDRALSGFRDLKKW